MQSGIIPQNLQGVLWSVNINSLNLQKNKGYIIHQILTFGTIEDIKWLFNNYMRAEIIAEFIDHPSKIYSKPVFNFIKNYLLGLKNTDLDEQDYVASLHGQIRQRTA